MGGDKIILKNARIYLSRKIYIKEIVINSWAMIICVKMGGDYSRYS